MSNGTIAYIAAVFVVAGLVKGVLGLGLPTVAMGLLAVVMPPLQAAAILVLPSLLTNVWQAVFGPSLRSAIRRLWPLLVGLCLGTWAGYGLLGDAYARLSAALLGLSLILYGALSFRLARHAVKSGHEAWLGPIVGAATGLVTAATGVFVIPAVPYLQGLALEKEAFVQALGLSFTVSTLALALNLALAGALNVATATPTLVALAAACLGMWIGQSLRLRLSPELFRRGFLAGLLALGCYLVAGALL